MAGLNLWLLQANSLLSSRGKLQSTSTECFKERNGNDMGKKGKKIGEEKSKGGREVGRIERWGRQRRKGEELGWGGWD